MPSSANTLALLGCIFTMDELRLLKKNFNIPLNDLLNKERDEIQAMDIMNVENISEELLLVALDNQIQNPEYNTNDSPDLVDQFETRYHLFRVIYADDNEMLNAANNVKSEFYENLIRKICIKFGFESIDCPDSLYGIVGKSLYRVFILNYRANLMNLIISYIIDHKSQFVKKYNNDGRVLSFSKKFVRRNDAVVVANLISIIQDIIEDEDLTIEEIIRLLKSYDEGEEDILTLYTSLPSISFEDIDNDFRTKFFSILIKQTDGYSNYISELTEFLYKIFPLRKDNLQSSS